MKTGSLCGQGAWVTAVSMACALLQLVRECKEVLKGGLLMKQYYQFMLQEVLDGLEKTDCNMDAFEEDLQKMLMVRGPEDADVGGPFLVCMLLTITHS